MIVVVTYALAVFLLSFISIYFLRRRVSAILIVVVWTVLGPILMQVFNYLLVGYLDPFWKWAATIQGVIALAASSASLGVWAAIETGENIR